MSSPSAGGNAAIGRMPTSVPCRLVILAVFLAMVGLSCVGCASIRVTDPPRTATEQFLLSGAAEQAVSQLSFETLYGRYVYLDTQYFAASEEKFVLGEMRAQLLLRGVQIVTEPETAEIIVEVRSGGVGIDRYDSLLGLPSIPLAAGEGTTAPLATPELALLKHQQQRGIANVAYVAYWRDSGEVVAWSGPYIGRTLREDWWFFGLGPRTIGDIPPTEPID